MEKLYQNINNYINLVINDAFKSIERENDSKRIVFILGNKIEKNVVCIVLMKSKYHLKIYNRVSYRLANHFKKNFGIDIRFFTTIKGIEESDMTYYIDSDNRSYGLSLNYIDDTIDPNHAVKFIKTKLFRELILNLFPWEIDITKCPFAESMYKNYKPVTMHNNFEINYRNLYIDIVNKLYDGQPQSLYTKWEDFENDYKLIENRLPDHGIDFQLIYED